MLQQFRCFLLWLALRSSRALRFEAWEGDLDADATGSEIIVSDFEANETDNGIVRARGVHESDEAENSTLGKMFSMFSLLSAAADTVFASVNESWTGVEKRIAHRADTAVENDSPSYSTTLTEENQAHGEVWPQIKAQTLSKPHGFTQLKLVTGLNKLQTSRQYDFTSFLLFGIIATLLGCMVLACSAYFSLPPTPAPDNGLIVVQGRGGKSGESARSGGVERAIARELKATEAEKSSGTKGERSGGVEGASGSGSNKASKSFSRRIPGLTSPHKSARKDWTEQYNAIQQVLSSSSVESPTASRSQSYPINPWRCKKTKARRKVPEEEEEDSDEDRSGLDALSPRSRQIIRFKSVPEKMEYNPDSNSDNPP